VVKFSTFSRTSVIRAFAPRGQAKLLPESMFAELRRTSIEPLRAPPCREPAGCGVWGGEARVGRENPAVLPRSAFGGIRCAFPPFGQPLLPEADLPAHAFRLQSRWSVSMRRLDIPWDIQFLDITP
jgi:hypothetical protein